MWNPGDRILPPGQSQHLAPIIAPFGRIRKLVVHFSPTRVACGMDAGEMTLPRPRVWQSTTAISRSVWKYLVLQYSFIVTPAGRCLQNGNQDAHGYASYLLNSRSCNQYTPHNMYNCPENGERGLP